MKYHFALAMMQAESGDISQAVKVMDTFKDLTLFNQRSLALKVLLLTSLGKNAAAKTLILDESPEFKKSALLQLLFC